MYFSRTHSAEIARSDTIAPTPMNPASSLLPLPDFYERVLVITAHPDDAEYAFGGTIGRLCAEGSEVHYLVCTDGSQGGEDPHEASAALTAIRYAEQRTAAELFGVDSVTFLGLPDGTLTPTLALRRSLVEAIRRVRPRLVLTHQPLRSLEYPIGASHPDHLAVGEAALGAVYPDARNPRAFPELLAAGLGPHRVTEVWVPGHEHTDFFVDVGPYHERKIAALMCHASQFRTSVDPRADVAWVVERMRGFGDRAGCGYAEGFKRIVTDTATAPGPVRAGHERSGAS
ncbi:PIG-L deacetylase family protein [Streptomyces sp. NPDC052496]|uniref:PIG-L deacetylase family protein n=1 Tax=Streptomyces sp. NPDC052496 TaxID=3154951 RepID=UPI0034397C68